MVSSLTVHTATASFTNCLKLFDVASELHLRPDKPIGDVERVLTEKLYLVPDKPATGQAIGVCCRHNVDSR